MKPTWTSKPLKDVAEVIPSGVDKKCHPDETKVRLCNYLDVYNNDSIHSGMSLSSATASDGEIKRCLLKKHDVVITKDSETPDDIGKPAVVADDLENVVCGYHLAILRPNKDCLNGPFLAQVFRLPSFRKRLSQLANGAIRFGLTTSALNSIEIRFPALVEQEAIAEILTTWDCGIRQLTDLIATKLRLKQGLMQQLLTGKRRFESESPTDEQDVICTSSGNVDDTIVALEVEFGLTGNSFQEGIPRVGECPDGWQLHSLGDVLKIVERPANIANDQTYQLVTAKRYRGGIVPREQLRGDQIKTKTQFFIAAGDFLISKRQVIHGACGLVPSTLDGALVSNEYSCLQTTEHLDPRFLNYLVHTRHLQQTFFHSSVGVALEKMIFRIDQWLKHQVNLPPIKEQKAIVRFLATMDREILLLARQRRLQKEQKKGLMQKLLTGEVRVKL